MEAQLSHTCPHLHSRIWDPFKGIGAHFIISPAIKRSRDGLDTIVRLVWAAGGPPLSLDSDSRYALPTLLRGGVILIGSPLDLPEDGLRLLTLAGYAGRYELLRHGRRTAIQDRRASPAPAVVGASDDEFGFVFRGITRDVARRPVLLIAGTCTAAVQMAALWVVDSALGNAEAPPVPFTESPFEAVLPAAQVPRSRQLVLADTEPPLLVSGEWKCDVASLTWKPAPVLTAIQVLVANDAPYAFRVGARMVPVSDSDLVMVLAALIKRQREGSWSSPAELQKLVDGYSDDTGRRQDVIRARIADLRRMSTDPSFVESRKNPSTGRREYRLRAAVTMVHEDAGEAPRVEDAA